MTTDTIEAPAVSAGSQKYLLDSWYCAGWSKDLTDKPIGITICDTYLVLFRGKDGAASAMDGRCPHRFAPLDKGRVDGDTLACPYHGLVFNKTGECILNPHGAGIIPPRARLKSYPVIEKLGTIWVWMGNPDTVSSDQLPNLDWMTSRDYSVVWGYLKVDANYQLVMDNLLDLTHAPFLHAETVGGKPEDLVGLTHEWKTSPGPKLHSNYFLANQIHPSPQIQGLVGDIPGDLRANMTWRPASILDLDIRYSPPGGPETDGLHIPSVHFLAPETEHTTHYYYALARNVEISNTEIDEITAVMVKTAFADEDEPMIRACQELMGTTDLMSLNPAILQTDAAGVQARRILKKQILNA